MKSYRIETFCAETGRYQYSLVYFEEEKVDKHCLEPGRSKSVHVVYLLQPMTRTKVFAVYAGGRRVSYYLDYADGNLTFSDNCNGTK